MKSNCLDGFFNMIFSSFQNSLKAKNPFTEANGFIFIFNEIFYFNKSKTKEGNKPKTMFNVIEITATA